MRNDVCFLSDFRAGDIECDAKTSFGFVGAQNATIVARETPSRVTNHVGYIHVCVLLEVSCVWMIVILFGTKDAGEFCFSFAERQECASSLEINSFFL